MTDAPLVTAAEISRLAGVTRATVSNWRRRHPDFPAPTGGSEARPLFELNDVRGWLREHGVAAAESPLRALRTMLRELPPREVPALIDQVPELTGGAAPGDPVLRDAIRAEGPEAVLDVLAERGLEEAPTTGVYPTPKALAHLMVTLAGAPAEVLDPACGSGALLLAAAEAGATTCLGQDALPVQVHRTRALLAVAAPEAASSTIATGDSLTADAFPDRTVAAVLCNPPFQQRDWGAEELALDPRWEFGVPPRLESELAWVQHALAHLRPGGRAVLVLPPAVAGRSSGRRIRANLLRAGALRAVIALPAGVAPPRQVALHLWVLRKPDGDGATPDDVLFLDAAGLSGTASRTPAWESAAAAIAGVWRAYAAGDRQAATRTGVAAPIRVMDVLDETVDVTPARHVRAAIDADRTGAAVTTALAELGTRLTELRTAAAELAVVAADAAGWRTATVRDLAAGGALEILDPERRAEPSDADLGLPALTPQDFRTGSAPSGRVDDTWQRTVVRLEPGDVVVPLHRTHRDSVEFGQVAGPAWAGAALGGHMIALRVDPDRLDPWFVAGFAGSPDAAATTGSSLIRVAPQRIRIPLLPLPRQREYGAAFRRLHQLRTAARRTGDLAAQLTGLVVTGLTVGALEPAPRVEKGK